MSVATNLESFNHTLQGTGCKLVAVTKTKPTSLIMEAYNTGFKRFGENRVQELKEKYEQLPGDIEWHRLTLVGAIGHGGILKKPVRKEFFRRILVH